MTRSGETGRPRRFTITLDESDYESLRMLAKGHRPPLTLQYVVQYAVRLLLERAQDPEFRERLRDPLGDR